MTPQAKRKIRRSRRKDGPIFKFVDITADNFRARHGDENARLTVRHQAARAGHREGRNPRSNSTTHGVPRLCSLIRPSHNGYDAVRAKYSFDITCLTSFTDIDLPGNAYSQLQLSLSYFSAHLQMSSSCFLAYLPCRYGNWPFLDDAVHCVAAKAAHMLGISASPFMHLQLYSKALTSLYTATCTQDPSAESALYCVTRLLVLYESLGPPNQSALAFHNNAGVHLIKKMGPGRSLSAFSRTLIRSQVPSVVTNAVFKKEPSFFETLEWQSFLDYTANAEADPDSQLLWRFLRAIAPLASVLRDIHILCEATPDQIDYSARSTDILERVGRIHRGLHCNHLLYRQRPPYPSSLFDLPHSAESPDRIRLRGFFFYTTLFIYRIQATFAPTELARTGSETEAQAFAAQALSATATSRRVDPVMAWHLEERNSLARSVVRTSAQWAPAWEYGKPREELMSFLLQRLETWLTTWKEEALAAELE